MRLPFRITVLLFTVITLFITIISVYFYSLIQENFTRQAEHLMGQSMALAKQRIDLLQNHLDSEMQQLAASLFTENEAALASMLAQPPQFTTDVVGFGERLRRRTTLDFLSVISSDGTVLSSSLEPATFGKPDPQPDFPVDEPGLAFDRQTRMERKKRVDFSRHTLYLRGGYFLKTRLDPFSISGVQMQYAEWNPVSQSAPFTPAATAGQLIRAFQLQDYRNRPFVRISIAISREPLERQKQVLVRNSIFFTLGALLFCLLVGYLLSLSITRPVTELQAAARKMASGSLDVRIPPHGSAEVAELIHAFNRMAQQLMENQQKLLQTERIAAWQEIARHLAHEIKNPLTPIRTSITNLRLSLDSTPEKFREIFLEAGESIVEEVENLRHLADEFARFARLPSPSLRTANLNETIQKALALYQGNVKGVAIRFNGGELPMCSFDPEQISEVIHNLLQNSVDAVRDSGMIQISTSTAQDLDRKWVCLIVQDNGTGMDKEVRQKIFTPYFTTKQKGTGLGLAIVHRIITEHGGMIHIDSEPGKGTHFEIRFPV